MASITFNIALRSLPPFPQLLPHTRESGAGGCGILFPPRFPLDKNFSVEQIKTALLAIRSKITEPQMSMLRALYLYRTLSMERIAFFGGYGKYTAGNGAFGALCKKIAQQLGFVHRSKTYSIDSGAGKSDSRGQLPVANG